MNGPMKYEYWVMLARHAEDNAPSGADGFMDAMIVAEQYAHDLAMVVLFAQVVAMTKGWTPNECRQLAMAGMDEGMRRFMTDIGYEDIACEVSDLMADL